MKSLLFTGVICLALLTGHETAQAQTDQKPVPKSPYLAPVPDYGHWTVTFQYESAPPTGTTAPAANNPETTAKPAKPPPPASVPNGFPTAIETIKTRDLRGIVLTFANGTTKQLTCQGDWVLTSTPKGPQLRIATSTDRPYIYYTSGFVLLDGVKIDPTTFKEAALHNGIMAFHYQSGSTEVWIDPDSMLPLTVKQPGLEATYQFLTPPPQPFDIPKDQATLMKKEEQAVENTRSMR